MPTISKSSLIAVLITLALTAASAVFIAQPTRASGNNPTKVKLYEGGKVVGEWTSEGTVRTEGDVLVFTVRKGVSSREVRVSGTYSAEQSD